MKRSIMLCLLAFLILPFLASASEKFEYYPMKIKVKELLKVPSPESGSNFVFPIDVYLTGISKDKKWYRFKVSYDLVFLGKYEFEGWTNVDPWKPFLTNATPEVIELK